MIQAEKLKVYGTFPKTGWKNSDHGLFSVPVVQKQSGMV
jgi:hypothetical protein